jgi:predicted Zn-dependent protease with MMP-like domain
VSCDIEKLKLWTAAEVQEIIESLPEELRAKARALPVTVEARPNDGLVEDGIEPDTLGLFTGPEYGAECLAPLPSQVILFLENLWDFCAEDEDTFREEVRRTYLHELGHYLGLDEDDLWDRGLD